MESIARLGVSRLPIPPHNLPNAPNRMLIEEFSGRLSRLPPTTEFFGRQPQAGLSPLRSVTSRGEGHPRCQTGQGSTDSSDVAPLAIHTWVQGTFAVLPKYAI